MDNNTQYKICPNCGNYLSSTVRFCGKCKYVFQDMQHQYQQPQYNQTIQPQYHFQQHQTMKPIYSPPPQNKQQNNSCCLESVISAFIVLILLGAFLSSLIKYIDKKDADDTQTTSETQIEHANNTTTEENTITVTTEKEQVDVTLKEQIIYEANDVIIKVTGIDSNNVSFYIENNSTVNLGFNMHSYAVNGIMTNENIYTMDVDVASHSKNSCTLEIPNTFLSDNNIDVIKNLTLHIWAYDNDAAFKEFDCGSIFIETSARDGSNNLPTGELLLEEEGLKYELLKTDGNVYYIGVTNTNELLCEVDVQNLVINDWTCDISYDFDLIGLQILPNCQNIIVLDMTEHMQEKGITDIEYISFNLDIRRNADYFDNYIGAKIVIE